MSSTKQYTLPNADFLQEALSNFSNIGEKVNTLNNLYLEQAKSFWRMGIDNTQTLYSVSSPEEFMQAVTRIMAANGAAYTEALLQNMLALLHLASDCCAGSVVRVQDASAGSLKFYDFYSKLCPSPLLYKFDDFFKNAVVGNGEALSTLNKVAVQGLKNFSNTITDSTNATLANLKKTTPKIKV